MAYKYREEIVGKRFLCVSSPGKLKLAKISEWEWRSGVVRAVSGKDTNNVELSVLVEFDGKSWEKREWIKIYEIYQIFLVEYTVVLVPREVQNKSPYQVKWPALNFKPLVDKVGISTSRRKPLECFVDRELVIIDEKEIIYYKEGDEDSTALSREYTDLKKAVKNWVDYQDGQKILLTTPTVLVGYRVEVYRAEGTTQWYTAVIKAYNHTSKTLAVTDDTVLEAHNEDPALVQMRLIDDGVVDSILRGVEVGITSRRRPRNNTKDNDSKLTLHNTRQPNPNPFQCVPNNSKLPGVRKTRQRHTSCRSNNPDPENTDCDVPSTRSKTITREKKRKISAVIEGKRYLKNAIKIPTIDENHSSVLLVNKLKSSSQSSGTSREASKSNKSSVTKAKQIKLKSKRRHKGKVEKNKDVSNETTATPVADIRNNLRSRSQTDSSFSPSSSLHENTHTASLDEKLATPVQNEETKAKGCLDKAIKREFSTILTDKQLEKLCIRNSTVSIKVKKLEDFPAEKLSISLRDKKDAQTINETTECMERNIISSIKKEILKDVSVRNTKLKHCKREEKKEIGEEKVVEKEEEKEIEAEEGKEIEAKKKIDKKNKGEKEEVKDIEKGFHNSLKDKNTFSDKELNCESSYSFKEKNFPDNGVNTILEQSILAGIQDNMHFKKQFLLSGNNNNNNSNSNSNSNNTEKKSLQPVPEEAQKSPSANIDLNRPVTDQITKLTKTESSSQNGNDSSPCPSPSKKETESLSTKGKKETTSKSLDSSNEKCLSSSKKPPTVIDKMDYSTPGLTSDRSGAQPERSRVEEMKNPKYSPASSPLIIDKHEPVHPYRDPELMRKNPVHSMLTPHKSMTQPSYPNVPTALPAGHGTLAASSQLPSHQLPRTLMPQVPFSPHQIPSLNSLPSGHLPLPHAATIGQIEAARGLSAPPIGAITSQQQQQQQQQQPPPPSHLAALQYPNAHLPILSSYGPIHGGLNSTQLEVLWQQQKFSAVANPQSYILTTHQEDLMREASLLHERELDRERLERLEKERRERRLEQERLERERQEKELAEREKMERERLERDKLEKERHLREERDLQEREQRQERQRVFVKTQEVTPAAAAVNQHFIESLKRASQRHEDENPSVKRHRQEVHIEEIEAKKFKPEPNSICDEEPKYISKKKTASGKAKAECQRSKISVCQVKQEESDNCPDLDYKDETMDTDNISQDSEVGYKTDIPMFKEDRISVNAFRHPPPKASVSTLKRTGEPFLQDGACRDVTPKLMKCRECRLTPNQRSKKLPNIFCRFYEFRKLRYSQKGFLMIAGFAELSDAYKEDIKPWDPELPVNDPQIDEKMSKYILSKVGDKFCELVEQEREARSWAGKDAKIAWKRAVTGVREMCDVCDTTLFNIHWVCHKCGFVACLDCYKARMNRSNSDNDENDETASSPEEHEWLTCSSNRQAHEPDRLMLTQIIPSNALWDLGRRIHELRKNFNIPSNCSCDRDVVQKNGVNQELIQHAVNHASSDKPKLNGLEEENKKSGGGHGTQTENLSNYNPDANSPLCLLADVAMNSENSRDRADPLLNKKDDESNNAGNQESLPASSASEGGEKKAAGCSTLRELLTKTAGKVKPGADSKKASKPKTVRDTLADIIQSVVGKAFPKENETVPMMKLMHYIPRMGPRIIAREIPISKHTLTETSVLYPDVPHSWLCDGRLLRLHEPKHKNNILIFQEQWKQGSPVIVSGVQKYLKKRIWQPESFGEEFGHLENDLVNCRTGDVWIGHPMKIFWEGFENIKKRLKDKNNDPMLLKLKDWPPGDDFSDLLPHRFTDLMQALPLPDYTRRAGILNLASRLPDFLVRPDLGPKMYNAYGSASFPSEGTTNLHLDVSDAVNIMVHVGIPDDGPNGRHEHIEEALKAIDDADCDIITKRRVREVNEIPGALWHIYCAEEADKIRDLLNKVGKENGQKIEPDHDPIHDQSWYLDAKLRDRLNKEYGVLGYTIVQCLGDAVFIPAGAPHQVRNLHSCVKVAEDFVSPEHLDHCFRMTQEFRHLSDTHSNHEDKLQVKNIIYHAVKDAIAVLSNASPE